MKTVHLNGGPWHDRMLGLRDEVTHFHVRGIAPSVINFTAETDLSAIAIPYREGTYSVVRYNETEFEWDGWVTHD